MSELTALRIFWGIVLCAVAGLVLRWLSYIFTLVFGAMLDPTSTEYRDPPEANPNDNNPLGPNSSL